MPQKPQVRAKDKRRLTKRLEKWRAKQSEATAKGAPKKTVAKKAPAKVAAKAPAKKTPSTKKAPAVKKAPATKAAPLKKAPATKKAPVSSLVVKEGEEKWTKAELKQVLDQLHEQREHSLSFISAQSSELTGLMRDPGDGAGQDQADLGAGGCADAQRAQHLGHPLGALRRPDRRQAERAEADDRGDEERIADSDNRWKRLHGCFDDSRAASFPPRLPPLS